MSCRMRLSEFFSDSRYKKGILNMQAHALSWFCILEDSTVQFDADILTYPLPSDQPDVVSNDTNGMDDLNDALAVTTNTALSFVPITLEELLLVQNGDKFCCTKRAPSPYINYSLCSYLLSARAGVSIQLQHGGRHLLQLNVGIC